jgi:MGT family glycosyltransferase
VTLGTVFPTESGDLFARVLDGLGRLPVDVVATIGPRLDRAVLGTIPDNVRVERYVPQHEVLPTVDVVVCHGGSGTTVAALASGLPVVLLPIGADQPDNAAQCERLGVGRALHPVTASAAEIAEAVRAMLDDDDARERVAAFAAEARSLPPAAHVVPELERIAAG